MADVPFTETQQPETQVDTPILTITQVAADKVRALLAERELHNCALRVFVQGGGCSGFSYGMGFEETVYPQDRVVESEGVRLVIDPTSLMYMEGAEIDYIDSLMGAGFTVHNPNAVSTCGCGHSFRTEEGGDAEAHSHGGGGCGCGSCG